MNPPLIASVGSSTPSAFSEYRWEGQMCNGLGATYGTPPMACLRASPSELVLAGPLGTFTLPLASVVRLGWGRMYPWFFAGIRIHHREPKFPEELQFKPLGVSTRELVAQLRFLGYPVG